MLPDQPSETLLRTAIRRATHQILDTPVILNDPIALQVVPEACDAALVARLAKDGTADAALLRSLFAMRSRFAEDRLAEAALAGGVRQYLMIAAGLDTFPWRQPDFARPMRLFAVDHPASLQFAQERFRACKLSRPPNLVHVPVDLERRQLGEQLKAHGFDVVMPTFISMIGVAQYLTATAVDAVFQFASTLPKGSEIVVSFAVAADQLSEGDRLAAALSMAYTASLGEPWQTRLRPADLIARFSQLGFCRTFHLTPELAQQRYFSGRRDTLRAPGWEQLIAAVI